MALRNQPYFPLYVQDYLTDEKLNMCSWTTQGIYIKILCILHKQSSYGSILFKQNYKQNESAIDYFASILIKNLPCQYSDMVGALSELIDFEVLIIDDLGLHQKRMVKDGQISDERSKAAKKGGGNPNLFKQNSKQIDKQNTEYENENEDEIKILNKKDEIKNLSKEYFNEVMESFSDWRTYLGKQHEIYLKENEYTYQIVIDTLKKITPSKFKDSVLYSMNSTYKKIYERPNDRPKTETKPKSKGINDVWQDKLAKLNQGA